MATQGRQRLLQEQYFFLCQCEACSQQEEQEDDRIQDRQQRSGVGGSQHKSGLLCGKCKGSLRVRTCVRIVLAGQPEKIMLNMIFVLRRHIDKTSVDRPALPLSSYYIMLFTTSISLAFSFHCENQSEYAGHPAV